MFNTLAHAYHVNKDTCQQGTRVAHPAKNGILVGCHQQISASEVYGYSGITGYKCLAHVFSLWNDNLLEVAYHSCWPKSAIEATTSLAADLAVALEVIPVCQIKSRC